MHFLSRFAAFACSLLLALPVFAADPAPPKLRLGDAVKPLAYDLSVRLDPQQDGFSGRIEIDVDVKQATDFFWMNGRNLKVQGATLVSQGASHAAQAVQGGENYLGLRFAKPVPAGPAKLTIAFTGTASTRQTVGIFRQRDLGEWYAYTQFEAANARRAFPSFDEPNWKTPWTVTLTVRKEHTAVSNTPVVSEREVEGGFKEVKFARTPPLPSYLVAFGVGPFEVVDGGTAGMKKTPLRFIVPKGRANGLAYAKESTGRILEITENYFGMPYPFEKLDTLGIPITVAFGAMENPGLITYRSSIISARPGLDDDRFRQRYAQVAAHEIAHQWFGDYVTMPWWDDIWLNESFANWMERKTVRQFNPAWEATDARERSRQGAFRSDRLASARQIRQPVEVEADIENAFDGITYAKGGAVLAMFEDYLGEDAFREGVRAYMKKHAFGNATAYDFFEAISRGDAAIAQGFGSFVMQAGLPMVDFELDCTKDKPALVMKQQRFAPALAQPGDQLWNIPVCVKYAGSDAPTCTMMRTREQRLVLEKASQCPAWVLPNANASGYFLSRLGPNASRAVAAAPLRAEDAIALIGDRSLMATSGAVPPSQLLEFLAPFTQDTRPTVVTAAAVSAGGLHPAYFDAAGYSAYQAWIQKNFGAKARELGWVDRAGDTDAMRKLRGAVVPLVANHGADAQLREQARVLAGKWLAGDRMAAGSAYREVLSSAARNADAATFDAMVAAARQSQDGATRTEIYNSLGHVRDPALRQKAFDIAMGAQGDPRELREIFDAAGFDADNSEALLTFMRTNRDAVASRMPEESVIRMPRWHARVCTPQGRDAVQQLYAKTAEAKPGMRRTLAQTLEAIEICSKARATVG